MVPESLARDAWRSRVSASVSVAAGETPCICQNGVVATGACPDPAIDRAPTVKIMAAASEWLCDLVIDPSRARVLLGGVP